MPRDSASGNLRVGHRVFALDYLDNPTVRSFLGQLPIEVRVEDYGGLEKIFYPDLELDSSGALDGARAEAGDIICYAPWGNVAVFYKPFRYAEGLIPMGRFRSLVGFLDALAANNMKAVFKQPG